MSRLDEHVGTVRLKMTFAEFIRALPWGIAALAWITALIILVHKYSPFVLPRPGVWFLVGAGAALLVPILFAIRRRPTVRQAAVAIDQRLGLKEKFSTALYVRSSKDPFATAAVRDAENAASGADLHDKFPVKFPLYAVVMLALTLAVTAPLPFLPAKTDLFARTPEVVKPQMPHQAHVDLERRARQALAALDTAPRAVADNEQLKMAKGDLKELLKKPIPENPVARERVEDALKRIEAIKQKIAEAQNYVTAVNEMNILKNIGQPSPGDTGPVSDAHRAFSEGKVEEAANDLKDAVDKFDKMSKADQEKAAQQMKNLADQIAQKANDPKVQENIKKELEKAGVDKQEAQKIADQMKAAANGDKQAQQQVQQMANQAIQNANQKNGQNQNQNQQQQQAAANAIKNAVQQGQQQANAQANAQQMAQTAKGLSQAMQQAAGTGSQKGQGQQAQAGGKSGQQAGNQGQNGQAQNGQGQGANGQGQQGQGQTAQQQMQQQAGQLQAMAKDAQAAAAGQQMANNGGQGQQGGGQGQQMGQAGNQGGQPGGQQGQQGQQQGGQAGNQGGVAQGGVGAPGVVAPFQVKQELSQSQTNEKGQIIASTFVKAPSQKGESHAKLNTVVVPKVDGGDWPVGNERIPTGVQKAVKDYFDTLKPDPATK